MRHSRCWTLSGRASGHSVGTRPGSASCQPLPDFAVTDRLLPVDPMPERQTLWVERRGDPDRRGVLDNHRLSPAAPRPVSTDRCCGAAPVDRVRAWRRLGLLQSPGRRGFLDFPVVLAHLAERGYVVASIAYRLSGEAPFPAQLEDLQAAIRFLRGNAERFGIDGAQSRPVGDVGGCAAGRAQCGELRRRDLRAGLRRLVRGLRHR